MTDIKKEKLLGEKPIQVSIEETKKIIFQMENCICKINLNDGNIEIGFLCKIPYTKNKNNLLPVFITNNNILNENDKNIILTINNELKKIKIDKSRKKYIYPNNNILFLEIKQNKDKIYNYLELDVNFIYKNEKNIDYKNKSIYILSYQEEVNVSYGLINDILDNKKIKYGSPILSLEAFKVIGIYFDNSKNNNINFSIFIKNLIDDFNKYKNEFNIIYKADKEGDEVIFGNIFVERNKNNIELIINGNKNELINRYRLKKGENNIKIIIKKKITNLEDIFYDCKSLLNIKELEHLDTTEIKDFSKIFYGCSSLIDINGLQNWNVSNGKYFLYMFYGCSSLLDINPLQNWNVSDKDYLKDIK